MNRKLIVHIGYPKTATTTLQLNLFAQLHREGKIEYLNHLNKKSEYLGTFSCHAICNYIMHGRWSDQVEYELKRIETIDRKIVVLSSENLSFFYPAFRWAYNSSQSLKNIERIKQAFKDTFTDIILLVGIRNQIDIIPSYFREQYNLIASDEPKFRYFANWIEANYGVGIQDKDLSFNYAEMLKECILHFGREKVVPLLYEDLKLKDNKYFHTLGELLEEKAARIALILTKESKNLGSRSETGNYLSYKPTVSQVITRPFRGLLRSIPNQTFYNFGKKLYQLLIPKSLMDKPIGKEVEIEPLTQVQFQYIFDRFNLSNHTLIEMFDFDKEKMEQYGYTVNQHKP